MAEFDIILPVYGQLELAAKCVGSVELHSGHADHRIIVIKNLGYTEAINKGLHQSNAPFVVLLNTDTEVLTSNWLEKMAAPMRDDTRLGMVGPATTNRRQGLAGILEKNTGFHYVSPTINASNGLPDVKIWFWCIMLSRAAIGDVGLLDERFSPGGGEDDDWMIRAYRAGWKAGIQTDVCVEHLGQASWPARESLEGRSERAHRLLLNKYPPGSIKEIAC